MAPILKMISDCQSVVEELDSTYLHAVFRPHDQQAISLDSPLEQRRAVSQVIDGGADVGARCFRGERGRIVGHWRGEQRLDRWADAIDEGAQIRRLVALWLTQLRERRGHGATLCVPHDD